MTEFRQGCHAEFTESFPLAYVRAGDKCIILDEKPHKQNGIEFILIKMDSGAKAGEKFLVSTCSIKPCCVCDKCDDDYLTDFDDERDHFDDDEPDYDDVVECDNALIAGFITVHDDETGEAHAFRPSCVTGFTDGVLFMSDGTEFDCEESFDELAEKLREAI